MLKKQKLPLQPDEFAELVSIAVSQLIKSENLILSQTLKKYSVDFQNLGEYQSALKV